MPSVQPGLQGPGRHTVGEDRSRITGSINPPDLIAATISLLDQKRHAKKREEGRDGGEGGATARATEGTGAGACEGLRPQRVSGLL